MSIKKAFWFSLGVILLGVAYAGLILPGIPWSTPAVGAAYCFAKSSDRMHNWIYSHPTFGPFLTNWTENRIFPTKAKFLMLGTMFVSLAIMWFTTGNLTAINWMAFFMALVAIWAWRYPGSREIYDERVKQGKRIGWIK